MPEAAIPKAGARVMDLQDPTSKMSKSVDSPQGTVALLDDPTVIERKIKRAVTDTETEVRYDPEAKPGVSNLLSILAAATGRDARGRWPRATRSTGRSRPTPPRPWSSCCGRSRRATRELDADPAERARRSSAKGAAKAQADRPAVTLARAKERRRPPPPS